MKKRGRYKKTKPEKVVVHPMQAFAEKLVRFLAMHSHDEIGQHRKLIRINAPLNGLRNA